MMVCSHPLRTDFSARIPKKPPVPPYVLPRNLMFTTRSFNKHTAVTDTVVFEITGGNPRGFGLFVENQDAAKTVVYYFEDSTDGITYNRVTFSNGGDTNMFTLLAGQ